MAKNISLLGANYPSVPAVTLPQTGGGTAMFVDADEIGSVENAMAIVIDGNTAPQAITSGQYLFIKNHSTLATGSYHATENIASGVSISSSNVSADGSGFSNALHDRIVAQADNFKIVSVGTLSFNTSGVATKAITGAKTTSRFIVQRGVEYASSVILSANCLTDGTVTFAAYQTSGNGSAFSGAVSSIVLLMDNR